MDIPTVAIHTESYNHVTAEDFKATMGILCFDRLFKALSNDGGVTVFQLGEVEVIRLKSVCLEFFHIPRLTLSISPFSLNGEIRYEQAALQFEEAK